VYLCKNCKYNKRGYCLINKVNGLKKMNIQICKDFSVVTSNQNTEHLLFLMENYLEYFYREYKEIVDYIPANLDTNYKLVSSHKNIYNKNSECYIIEYKNTVENNTLKIYLNKNYIRNEHYKECITISNIEDEDIRNIDILFSDNNIQLSKFINGKKYEDEERELIISNYKGLDSYNITEYTLSLSNIDNFYDYINMYANNFNLELLDKYLEEDKELKDILFDKKILNIRKDTSHNLFYRELVWEYYEDDVVLLIDFCKEKCKNGYKEFIKISFNKIDKNNKLVTSRSNGPSYIEIDSNDGIYKAYSTDGVRWDDFKVSVYEASK